MRKLVVALLIAGAPALASAQAQIRFFTDQQLFEEYNRGHGKTLKGTEDFEESMGRKGFSNGLVDPLMPRLRNGPYPLGLEDVNNMIVRANTRGGDPARPSPRGGTVGMWTHAAGRLGAVSDVVTPYKQSDSLDLIFLTGSDHTGVGFDAIRLNDEGDAGEVQIRVYDDRNRFLGGQLVKADPTGDQFAGVWSSIPIGRINIYSPVPRHEGADNIQLWIPEPGTLTLLGLGAVVPLLRRRHG